MGANALVGIAATLVLVLVLYGPWQMACTDKTRCELFIIRDKLFDIAANGELSFNSLQYRGVRDALNLMIRYSHRLTLPRVLMMEAFRSERKSHVGSDIRTLISSIEDVQTRKAVQLLMSEAGNVLFSMIIEKSFVGTACLGWFYRFRTFRKFLASAKFPSLVAAFRRVRDRSSELILNGTLCSDF